MIQGVNIESGDKIVLNGVIHTIDSVLMPSDVSISEYLGTHETNFADLYAALVLEGFENALECKHKLYALKYRERDREGEEKEMGGGCTFALCLFDENDQIVCVGNNYLEIHCIYSWDLHIICSTR